MYSKAIAIGQLCRKRNVYDVYRSSGTIRSKAIVGALYCNRKQSLVISIVHVLRASKQFVFVFSNGLFGRKRDQRNHPFSTPGSSAQAMSMNRPDETPKRVPMLRRSSLGDHSQSSFHGHGVYPEWIDTANVSTTYHPVNRLDFYGGSELKIDLDVSQFRREDISVKLCKNLLIIEGTHEARTEDMCIVERRFVRKFEIPAYIHYGTVSSKLSPTVLSKASSAHELHWYMNRYVQDVIISSGKNASMLKSVFYVLLSRNEELSHVPIEYALFLLQMKKNVSYVSKRQNLSKTSKLHDLVAL